MAVARGPRLSADQRRDEVVQAAMKEFATGGLHGTSTEDIATRAGISQPYLFRLFGTKKELFLACYAHGCDRVRDAFREAAGAVPPDAEPDECLVAMGMAYERLIADRDLLRIQMQAYVSADDPQIRAAARRAYAELFALVEEASGADDESVLRFFAKGMLLNVSAALGLRDMHPGEPAAWAAAFRRGR
ncbi:MAG: hypothetical protein QOE65_1887 [Solirubrobacteraceae bacterium]|jgi:AcrR family transcriptional regulator|nr:hypothetical protein [Solirubrobacteraceae bacterium]